jgi:PAS domain S-box-containing protein
MPLPKMNLRLFKIPLGFLAVGIVWALYSHPLLANLDRVLNSTGREIVRSLNHLGFVAITAIALYFQIKKQQKQILSSEEQYRNLFDRNPNPMWIYNADTLRFVKVNKSAIRLYGYTENEFLSMTVKDIRPEKEVEKFLQCINSLEPGLTDQGVWKHISKKGDTIYASVATCDLEFNDTPCRLVMANNITDTILKEERIKSQNAALHEIAWLNSHEVRKSLCSVISLIELLKDSSSEFEKRQYIGMLQQCTGELDEVLIKTNKRVDELKEHDKPHQEPVY